MRRLDALLVAAPLDDGGVVLGAHHAVSATQVLDRHALQLAAHLLGDHLAAGEDGDVLQHGLAAVAEAGRLDRQHVQHAAQLVQHQRGQRLTVHVLGDDHQVALAALHQLLQQRDRGRLRR
jgi:hypothetical protein